MFVYFTQSILVLFSLVSISITHKMASHFSAFYIMRKASNPSAFPSSPNALEGGVRYNIGTFDLETWSCELKSVQGAQMVWQDYSQQCDIELAGRWIMAPFVIVAFLLVGTAIWQMIGKRDPEGQRMKSEDVELENRKLNAI
jgi:hypothetical protein